jgi:hypothetical protein
MRLARRKRSAGAEPGSDRQPEQSEAEKGNRNGKREGPAREQEGSDQEKQDASCHAHADGKLLRIRRSEQTGAENENEESR